MRVLLAEDERTLAGFVAQALSAEGYAVTVVHDGPEAEAAARTGDYGGPAGELDRIFERFHRVDAGRSRDDGGSGLRLAIARALTEAHGGRIWAESAPGRGTRMSLELPGYSA